MIQRHLSFLKLRELVALGREWNTPREVFTIDVAGRGDEERDVMRIDWPEGVSACK